MSIISTIQRIASAAALLVLCGSVSAQTAMSVTSTAEVPWAMQMLQVQSVSSPISQTVTVDPSVSYQVIDGFGGCFNEVGWTALQSLPPGQRTAVINALFDAKTGCGFEYGRMPIGASDFARNWYSLDETPGDYALNDFSILRDQHCLIPYIRAALAVNPDLRIWGSPWSPPTWMKQNNDYHGGNNTLRFEPDVERTYAKYLARYVTAYQSLGIPVFAVFFQNEPASSQIFASCQWSGAQEHDFLRDYLGPEFTDDRIHAQLWLGTINDGNIDDYANPVLGDPATAKYITGVGYQWAGRDAIGPTHAAYPNVKLMQTETECGGGENNWGSAVHTWNLIDHYLGNYANSYMYWNMVLDQNSVSSWGWKQNAMITIDTTSQKVVYNPEYYVMKHFGAFVLPGAKRVQATGTGDQMAFLNPDSSIIVEMSNQTEAPAPYTIAEGSRTIVGVEPPNSFTTVRCTLK